MARASDAALEQARADPVWPAAPRAFKIMGLALVAALTVFPFVFTGTFSHHVMIMIFLHAIMAQSWNVIAGMSGQISLGQALFFGLGAYAFIIGDVWLGGRINLALTVQAREAASDAVKPFLGRLLGDLSAHNEPLIDIVRVLVLIVSLLLIYGIVSGRSPYPRWLAAVTPIVVLVAVFLLYAVAPGIGVYLLPTAMNVAHLVFFVFSTWAAIRIRAAGQ